MLHIQVVIFILKCVFTFVLTYIYICLGLKKKKSNKIKTGKLRTTSNRIKQKIYFVTAYPLNKNKAYNTLYLSLYDLTSYTTSLCSVDSVKGRE